MKLRFSLAMAALIASQVRADKNPAPVYKPANTKMELETATIEVPKDRVKSIVSVLHLPGLAPAEKIESSPPPKSFHKSRMKTDKPPAFLCSDTDESGKKGAASSSCYFTQEPLYNQQNPNLAYVSVPETIYTTEKHPVTGPLEWDSATNSWAILLVTASGKKLDPFYSSWLPLGPHAGDPASIGGSMVSDTCGPNSESMALMAAWSAKGPKSKVKPSSWLDESFLHGKKPEKQQALPSPLKHDYGTLNPDGEQQTAEELQRVINMAVLQKTDPTAGGGDKDFVTSAILADIEDVGGKHTYDVKTKNWPTTSDLVAAVKDRYAPVITLGHYSATYASTKDSKGKITKWTVTLTRTGGHFLAVNGFSDAGTATESLLIFDPEFANPYPKAFGKMQLKGAKTKDGIPIEVTRSGKPATEDNFPAWNTTDTDPMYLQSNKGTFHIIEGYHAVRID